MNRSATKRDTVKIHFVARTRDGGVIEDTNSRKALVLNLSDSNYTESIREAIIGMQPGEQKSVIADPEQTFGYRDHNRQISVPRSGLPAGIQKGDQLSATIQNQNIDAWVVQVEDDEVVLDTNHPLSGESIEYEIELISIGTH